MKQYNYKCNIAKNGRKIYYKRVNGNWKRISNNVGMKAEKGKRKYMIGSDYDVYVTGNLIHEPIEFDKSLNNYEIDALNIEWKKYREKIYKNYFFTRTNDEDKTILPTFDENDEFNEIILGWLFGEKNEHGGVISITSDNLKPDQKDWIKNCTKEIIKRYVEEINKNYNTKSPPYIWKRTIIQAIGILAFNIALSNGSSDWMSMSDMSDLTNYAYSVEELNFLQHNMMNLLGGKFCPNYMTKPGGMMENIVKEKTGRYSDLAKKVLSKQQQSKNFEQRKIEKSIQQALNTKFNTIKPIKL